MAALVSSVQWHYDSIVVDQVVVGFPKAAKNMSCCVDKNVVVVAVP